MDVQKETLNANEIVQAEIEKIRKFEGPSRWEYIDTLCDCFGQLDNDNDSMLSLAELQVCQTARIKKKFWLTGDNSARHQELDMKKSSINHVLEDSMNISIDTEEDSCQDGWFDYDTWDRRMPALIAAVTDSTRIGGKPFTKDVFVRVLCMHESIAVDTNRTTRTDSNTTRQASFKLKLQQNDQPRVVV